MIVRQTGSNCQLSTCQLQKCEMVMLEGVPFYHRVSQVVPFYHSFVIQKRPAETASRVLP